jgi:hypothetical protein
VASAAATASAFGFAKYTARGFADAAEVSEAGDSMGVLVGLTEAICAFGPLALTVAAAAGLVFLAYEVW